MSFGGSVSAMISSIKANQNLRQKRNFFDKNRHNALLSYKERKALVFKSLDVDGKVKLKRRIKRLEREKMIKLYKVWCITGFITAAFLAGVYALLSYAFF